MADSTDFLKWLERAEQDIKLIAVVNKEGLSGFEDSFCYLCQQAAEKLLKAFIIKNENNVPRSHDLLYLLGICRKHDASILILENPLTVLNEYSVSARYPGDFDDKRTLDEANEAYSYITEIKNFIQPLLDK